LSSACCALSENAAATAIKTNKPVLFMTINILVSEAKVKKKGVVT